MLTADHPNALWLNNVYSGGAKIAHDQTLSEESRVEHWETPDALEWDAFILPIDPTFDGTGAEFWTKEG